MKNSTKRLIMGFGFTLFTVIAGFASIISMPDSLKGLRIILITISVISLVLALYFFLSIKIKFKNALKILIKIKDLGIENIYPSGISTDMLSDKIKNAKFIKMIFTSGIAFFRTRENDLIKAFENNASILILLANPNSDYAKELELISSRSGEIGQEIEQAKTILNRCLKEAQRNTNNNSIGKFTIKQYNTQFRFPMVICDDKYGWITLSLPPERSIQSVSIETIHSENGFLKKCINHFDELWSTLDQKNELPKNQNDLIKFLVGEWKNEWTTNRRNTGVEMLKITDDFKYWVNGEHRFNIDKLQYDKNKGEIIFIKVGVKPNDNRRLLNELIIVNNNKLEGIESNYEIRYYRIT